MDKKIATNIDLDLLAKAIDNSGKSRREISQLSGLSMGYISMMLNGKRNITLDRVNKLAEVAGIDLAEVLKEVE